MCAAHNVTMSQVHGANHELALAKKTTEVTNLALIDIPCCPNEYCEGCRESVCLEFGEPLCVYSNEEEEEKDDDL